MRAVIEQISHLNAKQQKTALLLRKLVLTSPSLDAAAQTLKNYTTWFVYLGGNHVAVHLASGDDRRILLITPEPTREALRHMKTRRPRTVPVKAAVSAEIDRAETEHYAKLDRMGVRS